MQIQKPGEWVKRLPLLYRLIQPVSSVALFITALVFIGYLMLLYMVDFVTASIIGFCMLMGALEIFGKVDCYFHPEQKYCQKTLAPTETP